MTDTAPTLDDLMAKVGYFVFYWGLFEEALVKAIKADARQSGDIPSSVLGRLKLWRRLAPESGTQATLVNDVYKQARVLREIRNLLVHGLVGARAFPGEPYVECASLTNKKRKFTISQLKDFTLGIDACRRAMISLDNFNYRLGERRPTT